MSFWRHEEIYRSDVGLGEARNGNGCRRSPHSSAAMSFQSAIPRQVALQCGAMNTWAKRARNSAA